MAMTQRLGIPHRNGHKAESMCRHYFSRSAFCSDAFETEIRRYGPAKRRPEGALFNSIISDC